METKILPVSEEAIQEAARLLRQGQLVGIPTETVYGLGANAFDEAAVRSIFAAKGRPADNPLIVHVACPEDAEPLCEVTETARLLMKTFCPGPLTMLMNRKSCISDVVTAGLPSVAVRIPSHPAAHRLLEVCGIPVAAPSANTSGKPSPTTAKHVMDDLHGKLPLILDGGECQVGLESTVIDLTSPVPTVLRPGGVTPEMLLTVLKEVKVADSVLRPLREGEKALSPGMRYRHYAPSGQLTMVKGAPECVEKCIRRHAGEAMRQGKKARVFAFEEHLDAYKGLDAVSIGSRKAPEKMAHLLFKLLRQADDDHIPVLFSEVLTTDGIGLAIMNRLARAAAFTEIDADIEEESNA